MANDFSANPISIDTAYAATAMICKNTNLHIKSAIWQAPSTVGHQLVVKDRNGKIIANAVCSEANEDVDLTYICGWVQGLYVETIESGTLLIFQ